MKGLTLHRFGEDFAVEGYLRDPYPKDVHHSAGIGQELNHSEVFIYVYWTG